MFHYVVASRRIIYNTIVRIIMDLTETDLRMTYAYVCIVADAKWYFVGSIFKCSR